MSSQQAASFWPKMEDEMDLPALLSVVIREARESRRVPERELAERMCHRLGEEMFSALHTHATTERSRAASMFAAVLEWVSVDCELFGQRIQYLKAKANALGLREIEPDKKGAIHRQRRITIRLLAALFVIRPDLLTGISLRSLAILFGVTPALISNEVREFNARFGVRGRGQKSEQACLSYACAQEGNHNRAKKDLVDQ